MEAFDRRRNPLRAQAEQLLGKGVRVSRGEALYYAPLPKGREQASSPWFRMDRAQEGLLLRPTETAVRALEAWAEPMLGQAALGEELRRLRDEKVTGAELELFAMGVKQLELNAAPMSWLVYEKRLRQLCADCLREGGGGGLWACWACMALSTMGGAK